MFHRARGAECRTGHPHGGAPDGACGGVPAGCSAASRPWWVLGVTAAVVLPIGIVARDDVLLGHARPGDGPTSSGCAWTAFYSKVAPVPELPGLVLATAWAAGAAGLLAELLSSRRRVPAVFALTPALGLYLFAAALGTGELASRRPRLHGGVVLLVPRHRRPRARTPPRTSGRRRRTARRQPRDRAASYRAGAVVLAHGCHSPPPPRRSSVRTCRAPAVQALVAWHGEGPLGGAASWHRRRRRGGAWQGVQISTLVQVGAGGGGQPGGASCSPCTAAFRRESSSLALDTLQREQLERVAFGARARSSVPLCHLDQRRRAPPADRCSRTGPARRGLSRCSRWPASTGNDVPTWGNVEAIVGTVQVRRRASDGLDRRRTPRFGRDLSTPCAHRCRTPIPAELEAAGTDTSDPAYLQLPGPVPPRARPARAQPGGERHRRPMQKALALEDYLLRQAFHYRLPTRAASGNRRHGPGYGELLAFPLRAREPGTASSSPRRSPCWPGSRGFPPASPSASSPGRRWP